MRRWFPVLALLVGLGTFISCKHSPDTQTKKATPTGNAVSSQVKLPPPPEPSTELPQEFSTPTGAVDPFERYLAVEKTQGHEPALTRFTGECGMDIMAVTPKYAQRPGETWNVVPDLSKAKDDQETDFYRTVAVWHQGNRVAVELWGMELDTGDYYRLLYCLEGKKTRQVESVSWRMAGFIDSSDTDWGYENRWKLNSHGHFDTVSQRYVDLEEKPIAQPKLNADTLKSLKDEAVGASTWEDLELPAELLK